MPTARTAAPLDLAAVEEVLRPYDEALTLPGDAYGSDDVFDWEVRHFFEGGWMCVGPRGRPGPRAAGRPGRRAGGAPVVPAGARRRRRRSARSTTSAGTAATSCSRWGSTGTSAASSALTTPGSTAWRATSAPRRASTSRCRKNDSRSSGRGSSAGTGGCSSTRAATPNRSTSGSGTRRSRSTATTASGWSVAASHAYEIAANWKIIVENYNECYHCSEIHPELCKVTPPDSDLAYPERSDGMWFGGPMELLDHAVTMSLTGESLGVPIPGLPEPLLRRVGYVTLMPNLLISPHPDYVMTHRLVPLSAGRTWVECSWYFPPRGVRPPGVQPRLRARVLGHHEPRGLGRVRERPAQRHVAGLPAGAVLVLGVGRLRGAGGGRARLPGGPAHPARPFLHRRRRPRARRVLRVSSPSSSSSRSASSGPVRS